MSAHIHTYTFMHTHIQNVHMKRTQARLERPRGSERARSRCRPRKLCTSLFFDAIKPHYARTSLYPLPQTPIPLNPPSPLPNIPQNNSKLAQLHNGPMRSCRKIGGKTAVQKI